MQLIYVIQNQNHGLPSTTLLHLPYLICYLVFFSEIALELSPGLFTCLAPGDLEL